MSSTEDEDCMLNLDANIDVETLVKNKYDDDNVYSEYYLGGNFDSSDEDQESSESFKHDISFVKKESENVKCDYSALSDISNDSTDTLSIDTDSLSKIKLSDNVQLKKTNCKEKIIVCIDMSLEMARKPFVLQDGSEHTSLAMIKRVLEMFLHHKNSISSRHEYAVVLLYNSAGWASDFCTDPKEVIETLDDVTKTLKCSSCDLGSVISLIVEKYPYVLRTDFKSHVVQEVFRIILIYGRSNCMFHFSDPFMKEVLLKCPTLFMDILYIHEAATNENQVQEIYDEFLKLDPAKFYIFEVTHSITRLHNCMAKLLAHPLLRVPQDETDYGFRDIIEPDKDDANQSDATHSDATHSDATQSDATQSDPNQSDATQSDPNQSDQSAC